MGNILTLEEKIALADKKAQRAEDYAEIQNAVAGHMYCYRAQNQFYDIENYWSKRDDISYGGVRGREAAIEFYCNGNQRMRDAKLRLVNKYYPEVEICPENDGVGDMVAKAATTPYIIIAGDGQTAQGIWFSPGICCEVGPDCKPKATYVQEKVAIDFVKEDGSWKILHLNLYMDFQSSVPNYVLDDSLYKGRTFSFPTEDEKKEQPMKLKPPYSVTKVAKFNPPLPQKYETWDDSMAFEQDF